MNNLIQWYLVMLLISITALPISIKLFKNFKDGGFIFSKTIGLAISGFFMWFLSTFKLLQFNTVNSYICLGIVALISILTLLIEGKKRTTLKLIKERLKPIILTEIAFLLIFALGCHIKSYKPEINGTEKFMDYGFMNIMDKSDYMPSEDMWFSGEKINYYYIGQFYATYLNKLSGTDVSYGYNLALVTIFALSIVSVFSIGFNLIQQTQIKKRKNIISTIGGTISTIAVNLAGNFHYTVYGIIIPLWYKIMGQTSQQSNPYYFWNSTRFIGYDPDTTDKTIHEFPMYSYVLGDLHAHVINIIFVVTLLGLLLSHLFNNKDNKFEKFNLKNAINIQVIAVAMLIGIFKMSNYWDYPIYTVVSVLVIFFINLKIYKKILDCLKSTIVQTLLITIIPFIVSLPFMINFEKMSSEIKLVSSSTPVWQLAILWGLPVLMVICYFIITIVEYIKNNRTNKSKDKQKGCIIINYIKELSISDVFILIIGFCAIGLVIAPEIVYVKDIYEASQPRANTMFKLTYQSFIMFGICFGYIIVRLFKMKGVIKKILGTMIIVALLSTALYSIDSTKYWFENIFDLSKQRTLNGEAFFEKDYNSRVVESQTLLKDDYEIIKWLRQNTDINDVILEEAGTDFVYSNAISTFSARPTVLGWLGHEWLWRSSNSSTQIPKSVEERNNDINQIYTYKNKSTIEELIQKYNIKYIIIGFNERLRYNNNYTTLPLPNEEIIKEKGEVVFETNLNGAELPSYIVKMR